MSDLNMRTVEGLFVDLHFLQIGIKHLPFKKKKEKEKKNLVT